MDAQDPYGPLPFCVFLGLILLLFGAISGAYIQCRRLLPECPVTSIVPLGPIGTCRVNYAYDVLSDRYVGSLVLKQGCPEADGFNHTIAVCYDDRDPSLHEASIDADLLFASGYTHMRVVMWIGAAVVAVAACAILCICHGSSSRSRSPAPTAAASGLELSVQPTAAAVDTPNKLVRSDSAMIAQ